MFRHSKQAEKNMESLKEVDRRYNVVMPVNACGSVKARLQEINKFVGQLLPMRR